MVRKPCQSRARHIAFTHDHAEYGRLFGHDAQITANEKLQPRDAIRLDQLSTDFLKITDHVADALFHCGSPQLVLGLEVVMNKWWRDTMHPSDARNRCAFKPVETEGLQRCLENNAARGQIIT